MRRGTTECVNDVDDETSHCNAIRNICRQASSIQQIWLGHCEAAKNWFWLCRP